ncbi:MAG: hypothetical protein JST45_13760, partial [Bacteroidetes bacterium]|nr:hypothetical protein [Bacteroidota bacterium]
MKKIPRSTLFISLPLVIGCHTQKALAPIPAPAQLAQQNVDATIYQNMSAEVYRLYQQGYELAKIRLDANLARPHTKPPA